MKNSYQENKRKNERGSVLFYILIAVVLFAALSYTVGGMMRGGDASAISEQRAKLLATEILDYARSMKQATQQMKISNGCQDTDISFETPSLTGYTNGANTVCQIFDNNGGDINYIKANADITSNDWLFSGDIVVHGIGTTCTNNSCTELTAFLINIPDSVCNAINDYLSIDDSVANDVSDNIFAPSKFTGSYSAYVGFIGDTTAFNLRGKNAGCATSLGNPAPAGLKYFYQVLLPR